CLLCESVHVAGYRMRTLFPPILIVAPSGVVTAAASDFPECQHDSGKALGLFACVQDRSDLPSLSFWAQMFLSTSRFGRIRMFLYQAPAPPSSPTPQPLVPSPSA